MDCQWIFHQCDVFQVLSAQLQLCFELKKKIRQPETRKHWFNDFTTKMIFQNKKDAMLIKFFNKAQNIDIHFLQLKLQTWKRES